MVWPNVTTGLAPPRVHAWLVGLIRTNQGAPTVTEVGIFSEGAQTITTMHNDVFYFNILDGYGSTYEDACFAIGDAICGPHGIGRFGWVLPLLNSSSAMYFLCSARGELSRSSSAVRSPRVSAMAAAESEVFGACRKLTHSVTRQGQYVATSDDGCVFLNARKRQYVVKVTGRTDVVSRFLALLIPFGWTAATDEENDDV